MFSDTHQKANVCNVKLNFSWLYFKEQGKARLSGSGFFSRTVLSNCVLLRNLNMPECLSKCVWLAFQPLFPSSSCFFSSRLYFGRCSVTVCLRKVEQQRANRLLSSWQRRQNRQYWSCQHGPTFRGQLEVSVYC